jgi:trigger factor
MQVSVETTQGLERRMTVQVPADRVENEVENRLQSMKGRVRLDGFRPGKVPLKVVRQRYGQQVRNEVLGEVIQSTYTEALSEQELHPAGAPSVEPTQMEPGKDLEYTATFEVMPEVSVKDLDTSLRTLTTQDFIEYQPREGRPRVTYLWLRVEKERVQPSKEG